ncbi:MAG: TIGR03000 domain-containing protein [Gemmataceae bacterium]
MYSIVLATMLTTGAAAPDFGHGCRGCCGGCWGCCGGCWGCCGGCYGCWGCCGGCWGCCGGCYGGWYSSGWGVGCYGSCYGCWGTCYGCHGCYGCYGCYGNCYGGAAVVAAPVPVVPVVPVTPTLPAPPPVKEKDASLGNAAAVIVKAPANVRLSVEGRAIARTANEETFRTPELEPGYSYTYTFKAQLLRNGKSVAYTKQVKVRAGQTSTADFTKWANEGKDAARVTVKLPADARLYVDGVLCPLKSATRSFNTPELDAGRRYHYTLKAEVVRDGKTRTDSQDVLVEAGKLVTVEFKDLPVRTVSR